MADQLRLPVLVFDVNETLLDITILEPLFGRLFGDRAVLREWFAQLILYSQSMTLAGLYSPFGTLAAGTLRMLATIHDKPLDDSDMTELGMLMGSMPAHPDVAPALVRLRDAGFRMVTLSNSASAPAPTPLERAGLGAFFEQNFSVETVGRFKPAPETYRHLARALHVADADLCLIACHLWDTLGAQAAGCHAAFLARPGNALLPVEGMPVPELVAAELGNLAERIIQRWGA